MKGWTLIAAVVTLFALGLIGVGTLVGSRRPPIIIAKPQSVAEESVDDSKRSSGGQRHKFEEGKMGKKVSRNKDVLGALKGPDSEDGEPSIGLDRLGTIGKGGGGGGGSGYGRGAGGLAKRIVTPKEEKKKPPGPTERAWFPQTFLFEPLVVTSAKGTARVEARVPDRLTRWRVLALAHARTGALGGTLAQFLGTLPIYVEPVVPRMLRTGDVVRLPIQVVNTTETPVVAQLRAEAQGATLELEGTPVTAGAGQTVVQYATLRATQPGTVTVKVSLGAADAVVRTLTVESTGRPVIERRSGTLGAPRTFMIEGPAAPEAGSGRVQVRVYPGALGVMRSELGASLERDSAADDAYALMLAGDAPRVHAAFGDKADPEVIRRLAVIAGQRVLAHARSLDVTTAPLFAEAALTHADRPMLVRLAQRLLSELVKNQRPDGTFGGGEGWSLQRLLVTTAECARAVTLATRMSGELRRDAESVRLRAQGAMERNLDRIEDVYTAAAVLASGAMQGRAADLLRARVEKALKTGPNGRYVEVPEGVLRPDGTRPDRPEVTALVVLALKQSTSPEAVAARLDLGASLLGWYTPSRGWGDGRANFSCFLAVLELFKDPLPPEVNVVLSVDGKVIAQGAMGQTKLKEVLVLEGSLTEPAGRHQFQLAARPPVPGIGFQLEHTTSVPWEKRPATDGVELELTVPTEAEVGKPVGVRLVARAPSGLSLRIRHALPAGVQVDVGSLEALVKSGLLSRFETHEGFVDLVLARPSGNDPVSIAYRVIPTLAGTFSSGASRITAGKARFDVPPTVWTVR